ncbi:MAG TPA: AAA family ATPase [Actinomycetota bacterium]|nr:AAA family ATPase [Actinomycetota bacterium]
MGGESLSSVLGGEVVLRAAEVDVGQARERRRQQRLGRLAVVLSVVCALTWWRVLTGASLNPLGGLSLGPDVMLWLPMVVLVVLLGALMLAPMLGQSRSPHLLYRPEQIEVALDDVKGLDPLRDEVVKTLNLFLGYATFRDRLGGTPRRGILFEGQPGTGKTHMAKAMARHAGVPFLFVSATSFQSMWYGMTARKIRAYFKALRKAAAREGGAIGFIEEIDAIGARRGGLDGGGEGPVSSGTGGVVNELLVQLQSFDTPPLGQRTAGRLLDWLNGWLPADRQLRKPPLRYNNLLVIAATNRAETLDPALLRPGRFDRTLYFDLPDAAGRRELIDHFLARKAHHRELDDGVRRAELATATFGYTPVMIEHLLDEALIWALRHGRDGMRWADVHQARLSEEVGLKQPVTYSPLEKEMVATHEAGHAVAAYLSGVGRRLEVLSIVKRREALGLLAHNDTEERWTRTRTELEAFLRIACAGMAAEELWFGESTTGPGGDLIGATGIAAQMVGALGMSDSLLSYAAMEEGLNDRNVVARVLSDPDGRERAERLLREAKAAVKQQLDRNRVLVEALRDALLEREELIGDEILEVLRQAESVPAALEPPTPPPPNLFARRPQRPARWATPAR